MQLVYIRNVRSSTIRVTHATHVYDVSQMHFAGNSIIKISLVAQNNACSLT